MMGIKNAGPKLFFEFSLFITRLLLLAGRPSP
jgi:hypothetical protein